MNIEKISWDYDSDPKCDNGDIVVLVQYGEAEIAKYISPKPNGAPKEGGNFIFAMCDNEDDLEHEVFQVIAMQFPEIKSKTINPLLFICPIEFSEKAIWGE